MGDSENSDEPYWTMYVGGDPVGRLYLTTPDQPWIRCRFVPLEAWGSVQGLFELHNQAAKEGFPPEKASATREILDRGVELRPSVRELGESFRPFMVYVEGSTARFRP